MSTLCPISHPILCPTNSLQHRKNTPCVRAPNECDIDVEGQHGASVDFHEPNTITRQNIHAINSLFAFEDMYQIEQVLESNTGKSPSIMVFGHETVGDKPVAIKISPIIPKNMKFDGLAYESEMYMSMFYDFKNSMPNFISWVDSITISIADFDAQKLNEKGQYRSQLYSRIDTLMKNVKKDYVGNNGVSGFLFLITERAEGFIPLTKYIKYLKELSVEIANKRLCDLVFQIIFCLHVLVMRGFQHNDLHTSNILINASNEIDFADYKAMGKNFQLRGFHQLVVFDWDFGVSRTIGHNYLLESFCPEYGICNHLNERFDIYTILRTIHNIANTIKLNLPTEFKLFTNNVIQQMETEKFYGRMCHQQPNLSCVPYEEGRPTTVLVPELAILDVYFSTLRI